MNASSTIAGRSCTSLLATALMAALIASLVTACVQKPSEPAATAPAIPSEPATSSSRDFGDYILYFNAIRTDTLTPEVATNYGIARSANRALVNISLVKKVEGSTGMPVPGTVDVEVVNLNGQVKDLSLREIREGDAIYYIGDVAVANDETLVLTVEATPENTTTPLSVRFQRQFVGE